MEEVSECFNTPDSFSDLVQNSKVLIARIKDSDAPCLTTGIRSPKIKGIPSLVVLVLGSLIPVEAR